MRVLAPVLILMFFHLVYTTYLITDRRKLRAIIRDSDKPLMALSKEDRREHALELIERDREAYELKRQREIADEIKQFNTREMEK